MKICGFGRAISEIKEIATRLLQDGTFYERARTAFTIVRTGELRPYGNILLIKGVINAYTPPLW